MNKMREYERGREDGLDLARRIVKERRPTEITSMHLCIELLLKLQSYRLSLQKESEDKSNGKDYGTY